MKKFQEKKAEQQTPGEEKTDEGIHETPVVNEVPVVDSLPDHKEDQEQPTSNANDDQLKELQETIERLQAEKNDLVISFFFQGSVCSSKSTLIR